MLGPGPAPPGLRDFLPGGLPGHAEQLIVIQAVPAVSVAAMTITFPPPARPATSASVCRMKISKSTLVR